MFQSGGDWLQGQPLWTMAALVATFPADPDHPGMARRFADAAAAEFNRLHGERLAVLKRLGR